LRASDESNSFRRVRFRFATVLVALALASMATPTDVLGQELSGA